MEGKVYLNSEEMLAAVSRGERNIYHTLEEMFAAIPRDENGVLHPDGLISNLDGGPVWHLYCGKEFASLREFLADKRCNSGACNPLPVYKQDK